MFPLKNLARKGLIKVYLFIYLFIYPLLDHLLQWY